MLTETHPPASGPNAARVIVAARRSERRSSRLRLLCLSLLLASTACVDVPAPPNALAGDGSTASDGRPVDDAAPQAVDPCTACPVGSVCVDGRCGACEPSTHRGCDADSARPICDPESLDCVRCTDDGQCAGRYCLPDGRCAECRADANLGCGEPDRPICDVQGICRPCALDAECVAAGRAPTCDAGTGVCRLCLDGSGRGCDPTGAMPICEDNRCRQCVEGECGPGLLCLAGRCEGCNIEDNSGCDPTGASPICLGGLCGPCQRDGQCLDAQRGECVGGACQECDPETHAGCDADGGRPLCDSGRCVPCGESEQACADVDPARPYCLSSGQCGACDPVSGEGCGAARRPVCDAPTASCVGCRDPADCPGAYCDPSAAGRCVPCVAGTSRGCDPASDTPTCIDGTWRCGPCTADSCAGNALGTECQDDGTCGCDDDDQCQASPLGLHCHGAGTCGCHRDDECPEGRRCDGDVCQPQ